MKTKFTKKDFDKMFHDNDSCLEWIKNQQYPNGIECPICKKVTKHHKFAKRPVYECDYCGHQVSPLATTIFRKSSTPLRVWFGAIYEMATTRCGYSAKALQRKYGVTYKTAWRMFKQIRKLLDEKPDIFDGEVEVDETYVGGARHGIRGRGALGKTAVFGIVERHDGKVMTAVVPDTKRCTVTPIITKNVSKDAIIYSDEFPTYDHLTYIGFNHQRINHRAKQYVAGRVHTNSIEGFWSQFKRSVSGVYHSVSPKYLQSYLNEYAFRYNHRNDKIPMIQMMLNRVAS